MKEQKHEPWKRAAPEAIEARQAVYQLNGDDAAQKLRAKPALREAEELFQETLTVLAKVEDLLVKAKCGEKLLPAIPKLRQD